ncbi:S8 family serine peptidase [Crocosphaera sp. UHCC 0190]|uniref:S8 family peptidase n=1 Tax=Crocosphaera sp. UHCC 0190 TaxID=3110246 RepID=UPI002B1EB634|nr:S8 family serine peptidase [Crocosphaera sp. UHCC 0190]MEA5510566.1 S8 family serine peptidase [Crocosphaera sp. UHCC 0190]
MNSLSDANLVTTSENLSSETIMTSDGSITPQLIPSIPIINIPEFQLNPSFKDSLGNVIDGRGFSVVIIDTGIDLNHPFFGPDLDKNGVADRIVYQYDFSGSNDNDASDKNNHGSHVASIAASSDVNYPGVAPGANIIALKVFSDSGSGDFFDVQEALQWVIANTETYNIASVNMSLSDGSNNTTAITPIFTQGFFQISDELQQLADKDVIVVSAAGNKGEIGVSYPAADPNSLAVSAVDNNKVIASFSQYDVTLTDVFAPGVSIKAANQSGGTTTLSGTSMAAPYVTGAITVAQQLATQELGRRLTLDEIRDLLTKGNDIANKPEYEGKLLDLVELGEAILDMAPYDPTTHIGVNVNGNSEFFRVRTYGKTEDSLNSNTIISDNSNVLTITGNGWKRIPINYNITANTILEFDFESTQKGEIHAIGFDTDNVITANTTFKLFGTQDWVGNITNFEDYTTGIKHYQIRVGDFFTGEYDYLTFVNDYDVTNPNAVSIFKNIQLYEFVETPPIIPASKLNIIKGNTTQSFDIESYGGDKQDLSPTVTLSNDGNQLQVVGNGWKKVALNYNITANTVLEFDFESTAQGEIHGIGFDNDNNIDGVIKGVTQNDGPQLFQVYGTQNWGRKFDTYTGGIKHYKINVGDFFTGNFNYLTFANDHDVTNPNALSKFSNIKLSELPLNSQPLPGSKLNIIKGNTTQSLEIESYGGEQQDLNPTVTLSNDGNQLQVVGNGWKKVALNYNVTANTVLEFDFESTAQGEIHGIGFDNDNNIDGVIKGVTQNDGPQLFQVYGTQNWGRKFDIYTGGIKHYKINVGDFFTGNFNYLTFANDHDVTSPNALSKFSNIKLSESSPMTQQVGDTLLKNSEVMVGLNSNNIDYLIATEKVDNFSLGNSISSLYNKQGDDDYAVIQGFDVTQDIINLYGQESDYLFSSSSGSLPKGTAIFLKTNQGNELIGIVENVTDLTVKSYHNNFNFTS